MTALSDYARLEAAGVLRPAPGAQRRDVIVTMGEATLTLIDHRETALAHWSLPAVVRLNPGEVPALFAPGPDAPEVLEIADEAMVAAVMRVRAAVDRARPRAGRLRLWLSGALGAGVLALAVFWLPGAMVRHAAAVLPEAARARVGQDLLANIARVAGSPCASEPGQAALDRLVLRVLGPGEARAVVLPSGAAPSGHLPGGIVLLDRTLVELAEGPEVAAGAILAERLRADRQDPVVRLLDEAGIVATFRLLTTGAIPRPVLDAHAERLLGSAPAVLPDDALVARFEAAGVASTPYAYALDVTGETVLGLIEADPLRGRQGAALLTDGDWLALQGICG
ncbi:MAG: hypothetical protein MUF73_06660 [Rhodobacteraceae bacterium]|jgi:hypothetical protein|nr:hypothetical protein [Paracoccaceae bacterium]